MKWVSVLLVSMVLLGTVAHLHGVVQKGNRDRVEFESKFRQEQQKKLDELKNSGSSQEEKIKELENKLQSKLDAKARQAAVEASKKSVVAQVASVIVPHAQAAPTGSRNDWMAAAGIPNSQWGSVDYIVSRESGWNPNAVNKNGGACGLGQQLPCGKWAGAWNDPVAALKAMTSYVNARYGGWAGAVSFWKINHWY